MRVVSVVGARPQFVKLEPLDKSLLAHGIAHRVLHTGQHYDYAMSQAFFDGLRLPEPAWNLAVGSDTATDMTASILTGVADVLSEDPPDWVVVYGDTNSTLAAALAAAQLRIPLAHVEAGLRSHNRDMPEEMNRIVVDHLSDLLLAPTHRAMANLNSEGLGNRAILTGDVMADLLLSVSQELPSRDMSKRYVVCTLHRASNTDDPDQLRRIITNISRLDSPVILLAHPRLSDRAARFGINLQLGNISVQDPLPYLEMIALVAGASGVITDSGGLQKEACLLGVPCTTLRTETEWVETLEDGRNVLDVSAERLAELAVRPVTSTAWGPYGNGDAADRIVDALTRHRL